MINSRRMGETAYKVSVWKPEDKRPFESLIRRWKDFIVDLK